MKRFFVTLPVLLLFIFFSACDVGETPIPDDLGTAVALTQTAVMWTPTVTSTPDPNEPKIIEWLNEYFTSSDALQQTFDVKFRALDVMFPLLPENKPPTTFRVDVHCECANNRPCCTPERAFVVTMWAMRERRDKISEQVPDSITELQVVSFDHSNQIGMVIASWQDVEDYITDKINGYQLGSRARTLSY